MHSISRSIREHPEQWSATGHTLIHESGTEIWTCNGFWFVEPYNTGVQFSFVDKWHIWQAVKWWTARAPVEALVAKPLCQYLGCNTKGKSGKCSLCGKGKK